MIEDNFLDSPIWMGIGTIKLGFNIDGKLEVLYEEEITDKFDNNKLKEKIKDARNNIK